MRPKGRANRKFGKQAKRNKKASDKTKKQRDRDALNPKNVSHPDHPNNPNNKNVKKKPNPKEKNRNKNLQKPRYLHAKENIKNKKAMGEHSGNERYYVEKVKNVLHSQSKIIRKVKYDSPIHLFSSKVDEGCEMSGPIDWSNFIFTMIDFSPKNYKKIEEQLLLNSKLRAFLPTGITLIKIQDSMFKNRGTIIARYGLQKFFEIKENHIEYLQNRYPRHVVNTDQPNYGQFSDSEDLPIDSDEEYESGNGMQFKDEIDNFGMEEINSEIEAQNEQKVDEIVVGGEDDLDHDQIKADMNGVEIGEKWTRKDDRRKFPNLKKYNKQSGPDLKALYAKRGKNWGLEYEIGLEKAVKFVKASKKLRKQDARHFRKKPNIKISEFQYGAKVHAFKKLDGENAQISFIYPRKLKLFKAEEIPENEDGFWLVSSKNVSVVFRKKSDLENYELERFQFVLPSAYKWVEIIQNFSEEQLLLAKELLHNDTLIGCMVGSPQSQRPTYYKQEELIFFSSTHRIKTSTLGKDGNMYPNSTSVTLGIVNQLGLKSSLLYSSPGLIGKTYEFVEELVHVQKLNQDIVVYCEKFFREETQNCGLFQILTRKYNLMKLFKEKIHQLFCGRINRSKLWKKLPQHDDLFYHGKKEGDMVIDCILDIVERLGGGKRSGKEWEGMAKGLKYVLYWVQVQLNKEEISEKEGIEDQENICNLNRIDLLVKCQDIIHAELGKSMGINFGLESSALKTGPNIVLLAPPGFVPFTELQKLCTQRNWDLSFKLSQRKNLRTMIRLVSPSICSLKAKHIKPHTYFVPLDVKGPSISKQLEEVIHSIANAFNGFTDFKENVLYTKYLTTSFSNVFQYAKVKTKVLYELRKQQKMKSMKEAYSLENYDLWKVQGEHQLNGYPAPSPDDLFDFNKPKISIGNRKRCYNFNFSTLENLIDTLLVTHKNKVLDCQDDTFDFLADNQVEIDKKLKKQRRQTRDEKKDLVMRLSQHSSSSSQKSGANSSNFTASPAPRKLTVGTIEDIMDVFDEHDEIGSNQIMFVYFYGLVGLGKSTLIEMTEDICKNRNTELGEVFCQSVSSDLSQKAVVDKYESEHPKKSRDECIVECKSETNKIFENGIFEAISKVKPGFNIIFLDKNRLSNKLLFDLNKSKQIPHSYKTQFIAILPKSSNFYTFGPSKKTVPFSASLILNLCLRVVLREGHATIKEDESTAHKVWLALSFVLLYKNIKSIQRECEKKLNGNLAPSFYQIPFCREIPEDKLEPSMLTLLSRTLSEMTPFDPSCIPCCEELGEELEAIALSTDAEKTLFINYERRDERERIVKSILGRFQARDLTKE